MWIVYGVRRHHDCPDHILENGIERKTCNRQSRKKVAIYQNISQYTVRNTNAVHYKKYECVRGQISVKRRGRMHRLCADLLQTDT